jgi:hypothetical protein
MIAMAREYADNDKSNPGCGQYVEITTLEKACSSKNIPALQMADFAAYESLKAHRERNEWFLNEEPFIKPIMWGQSQFQWWQSKKIIGKERREWPFSRKSYNALFGQPLVGENAAKFIQGHTWTYNTLLKLHCFRRGVWSAPYETPS